jgi:hypothetical protein
MLKKVTILVLITFSVLLIYQHSFSRVWPQCYKVSAECVSDCSGNFEVIYPCWEHGEDWVCDYECEDCIIGEECDLSCDGQDCCCVM